VPKSNIMKPPTLSQQESICSVGSPYSPNVQLVRVFSEKIQAHDASTIIGGEIDWRKCAALSYFIVRDSYWA